MILENVPSAGFLPVGVILRQAATRAISHAEIQVELSPGSQVPQDLRDFFLKCAELCPVRELVGPPAPIKKEPK